MRYSNEIEQKIAKFTESKYYKRSRYAAIQYIKKMWPDSEMVKQMKQEESEENA